MIKKHVIYWAAVLGYCCSLPVSAASDQDNHAQRLSAAWSSMLEQLSLAEAELHAATAPVDRSERTLADGYRYLMAHLNREIEMQFRMDPEHPEFFRSMDMLRKWTGENPDTSYLKAPIDGESYYDLELFRVGHEGKRYSTPLSEVQGAPQVVTLQTITGVPGYTGQLQEMRSCRNHTLDFINNLDLTPDADGRYRLLIGPERPVEYAGLFLDSKTEVSCAGSGESFEAQARYLSIREIFSDWNREQPLGLTITKRGSEGAGRAAFTVEQTAETIRSIGESVRNQVAFWNKLMQQSLEMDGDYNNDGKRPLPVNGINDPALPFTAAGVAGAKQIYAAGIYDLKPDEALLIKLTTPEEPRYVGFHLNNPWMEGLDQQNFVSSLTGDQNPAINNTRYYIISEQDPGVRGWIDTTGVNRGLHTMRFIFSQRPEVMPSVEVHHLKLSDLARYLPENHPKVSAEQRRLQVFARQEHIKARWRGY